MTFDERINELGKLMKDFLIQNNLNGIVKPKDVMLFLIEKGVYKSDNRNGNPLRKDLRKLKELNRLDRIPGLVSEPKAKNTYWYFKKV